jgi:hypothetical protein
MDDQVTASPESKDAQETMEKLEAKRMPDSAGSPEAPEAPGALDKAVGGSEYAGQENPDAWDTPEIWTGVEVWDTDDQDCADAMAAKVDEAFRKMEAETAESLRESIRLLNKEKLLKLSKILVGVTGTPEKTGHDFPVAGLLRPFFGFEEQDDDERMAVMAKTAREGTVNSWDIVQLERMMERNKCERGLLLSTAPFGKEAAAAIFKRPGRIAALGLMVTAHRMYSRGLGVKTVVKAELKRADPLYFVEAASVKLRSPRLAFPGRCSKPEARSPKPEA